MTTNECKTKCQKLKSDWKQVQRNALMTIITMQTATQQHDSLKVQGIDALIAFFWLGSRLTPCPFPPQQHLFFTSHEAKETDVASFVKVILGDWVHWREGEESVKKEETKKKKSKKKTPIASHLPAGFPLTPPSSGRQTEPRGAADEAERGVCPRPPPGLSPPLCASPGTVGGVWETGASHRIWSNLWCVYAKPPRLIRFAPLLRSSSSAVVSALTLWPPQVSSHSFFFAEKQKREDVQII